MNLKRLLITLSTALLLIVVTFWIVKSEPMTATELSEAGIAFGDPEAPNTVIEFSNFECPYCKQQHDTLAPTLKELIDTGKVHYVFKPVTIEYYEKASVIENRLKISGEEKLDWEALDYLFANQTDWKKEGKNSLIERLEAHTPSDGTLLPVEELNGEAESLGLESVPTLIINGNKVEKLLSEEELLHELD
ncbi:DsbA family protein [Halobacillus litoralis]|uniref:thioredoxin domain-containing protein n=1 Tax=Halobacillus litoralis TaxID=45668 RepID=UPI001CD6AACE|nr:thioredoxin domain-containing protein [Halobacillus litoralis]MCA0971346.1 DsbA family protein [Halobacillus litoralis]